MNKKSRTRLLIATGVIVVAFVASVVVLVQRQGAYYRQVSDLTYQYDGKNVKVSGRVQSGSIERDAGGVHFAIQDLTGRTDTVKVTYSGQVPSTFVEGVDVVIVGRYAAAEGVVSADELQTKCPSKYEGRASPAAEPGQ